MAEKSFENISSKEREELLKFAVRVADKMRELILELWTEDSFSAELKSDATPVTKVDLEAEQLAREMISREYPSHGIIGEEYECLNPGSEFQWTIDPIDGTQNLVKRIPTFGSLLGLRFRGEAFLGVIDHPALDMRIGGAAGMGVWRAGKRCVLGDLPDGKLKPNDLIATSTLDVFQRNGHSREFMKILELHPNTRIYYDCYAHTLTALGAIDATVEFNLKIWDLTPTEALLPEAGGAYARIDAAGTPQDVYHAAFGKKAAVEILRRTLAS